MRLSSIMLAAVVSFGFAPVAAHACSVVVSGEPTRAERRQAAEDLIERATAIVDGEVIRPLMGSEPALVRVSRVLKGDARDQIVVGERDSCDLALTQTGTRLRLVLVGGPEVFYLPVDYSNAADEDRVLGSDRRRDWPYRPGGD